ncbi:MAG: hypothetical protein IPO75_14625 [Betaproteobacteria bacterium]|nr:hypothetical protein [Betaproteobacteria bacterium]
MVARLAAGSWARAVWLVSPSALAQLFGLTTVIKNVLATENVGGFGPQWFNVNPDGTCSLLGSAGGRHRSLPGARHQGRHHACKDPKNYLVGCARTPELLVDSEYRLRGKRDLVPLELPRVDGAAGAGVGDHPKGGQRHVAAVRHPDAR